ncbi:sensor histidine kinase [Microbacterium sp. gxy059]|uniref:sensor histidine kinase n=1 Tax=Microbacterium sp. gxy059 TaxID=2957199 RepID=UPI003D99B4BF
MRQALDPVFSGLRWGLHALLVGLAVFAVAQAVALRSPTAPAAAAAATAFVSVYLAGVIAAHRDRAGSRRGRSIAWAVALTALWALLMWLSPGGAYLVFPLFFLWMHLFPGAGGVIAILAATGCAIVALGLHHGFSVGGVMGPLVGAGVALLIGLAYRAMVREAAERERLLGELLRTRRQLAETEREQGALEERSRLARDIHDTVAQGLSSIQMLLRAVERDAEEPAAGYLRLARETAAESLADTRQIIRELTPVSLGDGLPAALRRLGDEQSRRSGIRIDVEAGDIDPPMPIQTALLRIAQGAVANAVRHAEASRIGIVLDRPRAGAVSLAVRDDGRGFDAAQAATAPAGSESFGLRAMRERVAQLGGEIEISSAPGRGTAIEVTLEDAQREERRA